MYQDQATIAQEIIEVTKLQMDLLPQTSGYLENKIQELIAALTLASKV